MNEPALRRASRLILLDAERRVLLLRHARGNDKCFWAPPGGGLEHDETFEQAALCEAKEELGVAGLPVSLLWRRWTNFWHIDRLVNQEECFFLIGARCKSFQNR